MKIGKLVVFILVLCSLVVCLSAFACTQEEAYALSAQTLYIDSEADWLTFATYTKKNIFEFTVYLQTDIYFDRIDADSSTLYSINNFTGKFYGNNHSLVGYKSPSKQSTTDYCGGIFGTIYAGSVIQDLNVVDASITAQRASLDYGAALFAMNNYGTIKNVKVSGKLSSVAVAGGIAIYNAGIIEDCVLECDVTLTGYIKTSTGSETPVAGNVIESGTVVPSKYVGTIVVCNSITTTTASMQNTTNGTITGTYASVNVQRHSANFDGSTPIYEAYDSGVGLDYYVPIYQNTSDISKGNYTAPSQSFLLQDSGSYLISDYFDLMWLNATCDLNSSNSKLGQAVNLFGRSLDADLYTYLAGSKFDMNNFSFYNTGEVENLYSAEVSDSLTAVVPTYNAINLEGSGTAEEPYRIGTAKELLAIGEAANTKYTLSGVHLVLTNNISLIDAGNAYFRQITNFAGVFDGGGFSICGVVADSALFGKNVGTIKNLFIQGELTSQNEGDAFVVATNNGLIENVEVCVKINDSTSCGIAGSTNSTISKATVRTFGSGYAAVVGEIDDSETLNVVQYSRNYGSLPFVGSIAEERRAAVLTCYTKGDGWVAEGNTYTQYQVIQSISEGAEGLTYYSFGANNIYTICQSTNTAFGATKNNEGWAYKYGSVEDIPTLVFINDGIKYKTVEALAISDQETTYSPTAIYDITGTDASEDVLSRVFDLNLSYDDDVSIVWYKKNAKTEDWEEINTAFYGAGEYKVEVELASTIATKGGYATATFTINKAPIELTADDFFVIHGVTNCLYETNDENAIDYTGLSIGLETIVPDNLPSEVITSASIKSYSGKGVMSTPSAILEAGVYYINFKAYSANYETFEEELEFVVNRLPIYITPSINFDTLEFGEELEKAGVRGVAFEFKTGGGYGELSTRDDASVIDLSAVTYVTDYEVGVTPVGTKCTITAQEIKGKIIANNYDMVGKSVTFTVIKASIDTSGVVFVGGTYIYDGESHIPYTDGIPGNLTSTLYYSNAGEYVVAGSNMFIDAKTYAFKLVLSAGGNFYDASLYASVTITPKSLQIIGKNYNITYGDQPPKYEVEEYELFARADGKTANYGMDGTLVSACKYNQGSDASAEPYEITWSGLSCVNYSISYTSGNLYVAKADRDISLLNPTMDYNRHADGSLDIFEPKYSLSSSLFAILSETYYVLDENEEYQLLDCAPAESGKYRLVLVTKEDTNYNSCEFSYDITISPKTLTTLTLAVDGALVCLGGDYNNTTVEYDGNYHTIDVYGSFPQMESFTIKYYFGQEESLTPFSFKDVYAPDGTLSGYGKLKVVVDGNPNYEALTLESNKLVITPVELKLQNLDDVSYTSYEIVPTLKYIGTVYNEDVVGYTYSAKLSGNSAKIYRIGEYIITATSLNANYQFTGTATLNVVPSVVRLDWDVLGGLNVAYGSAKKAFNYVLTFDVCGVSVTKTVKIDTNVASSMSDNFVISMGTYSILDSAGDNKYAVTSDDDGFLFESYNGINAITVTPRPLSFVWGRVLPDTYTYDGSVLFTSLVVPKDQIENKLNNNDNYTITLTPDREVIDAGSYVITATLSGPSASKYVVDSDCQEYILTVSQAPIKVNVYSKSITYGQEAGEFSSRIVGAPDGYTANIVYKCDYQAGDPVGTYEILVEILDGNYVAVCESGKLTVNPADITSGVRFVNQSFTYTGSPIEPVCTVPSGATYYYEGIPTDVGSYKVKLFVNKPNYNTYTQTANITVKPAKPVFVIESFTIAFEEKREFTQEDFESYYSATFNDSEIDGKIVVVSPTVLSPGEVTYKLYFAPESANFSKSDTVEVVINATVDVSRFELEFLDTAIADGVLSPATSDSKYPIISIKNYNDFGGKAELYVNGEKASLGSYIFTSAQEDVQIKIVYEGMTVYSATFDVIMEYTAPPEEDGENGETDSSEAEENNGGNNDKKDITKLSTGAIIGISVGGGVLVIAGVIIAIILIKRRSVSAFMPTTRSAPAPRPRNNLPRR